MSKGLTISSFHTYFPLPHSILVDGADSIPTSSHTLQQSLNVEEEVDQFNSYPSSTNLTSQVGMDETTSDFEVVPPVEVEAGMNSVLDVAAALAMFQDTTATATIPGSASNVANETSADGSITSHLMTSTQDEVGSVTGAGGRDVFDNPLFGFHEYDLESLVEHDCILSTIIDNDLPQDTIPHSIAYDAKDYFKDEKECMLLFGQKKFVYKDKECFIPRRGHFYCNVKGCSVIVPFTYRKDKEAYVIKSCIERKTGVASLCLEHNHPTNDVHIDGYVYVKHEQDLTSAERSFIENIALVKPGIPSIKEALGKKFLLRDFDKDMLHRLANKARADVLGKDRHQLGKLREQGQRVHQAGGIWKEHIDPDTWRLCGTLMQTSVQREFALEFGAYFNEGDGTHSTNMYGLIAFLNVTVDSLGKSVILGIATMESENTERIVEAAEEFGLSTNVPNESAHLHPTIVEGIPIKNRLHRIVPRQHF